MNFYKNFYSTESFVESINDQQVLPKYVKKENYVKIYNKIPFPELYITCWNNGNLVGCLKQLCIPTYEYKAYYKDDTNQYYRTIMFVSVLDSFKNMGIASNLFKKYFEFCNKNKITDNIILSPYSKEGFTFLKRKINQLALELNINIVDSYCFES